MRKLFEQILIVMRAGIFLPVLFCAPYVLADDLAPSNPFAKYSDPEKSVLAVQTAFDVDEGNIRVVAYENELDFLKQPIARFHAQLDPTGLAIISLASLTQENYSFVAYLDENHDGKLNRNILGKPKEPYIFSNGVRAKLRKPTFEETKVSLQSGNVIVLTIKD